MGGVGWGVGIRNVSDILYVGSNNKEVRDYVGFAEHRLRVTDDNLSSHFVLSDLWVRVLVEALRMQIMGCSP